MSNAALYMNPEAFDTSAKALMGRHAAGESFLRGYLRHADVEAYHFWNVANRPQNELETFINLVEPVRKPINWLPAHHRGGIRDVGVLNLPVPGITLEAWARRPLGDNAYAICGITHTTATERVMDVIGNMLIAPVQPWDTLICTSRAVRAAVETQLEATTAYLTSTLGATTLLKPRIETIPLGINAADFFTTPGQKKEWRERLAIDDDTVVCLYVGRFNPAAKMNPIPMGMALERAALLSGKKIAWVVAGWGGSEELTESYHKASRESCPSIQYIPLDGRLPEVRFSIWAVGDFFLSLSDNVQETFGLTPVEAMAAGMPNIVSDWDGYRDTVRHGIDGFRVSTYAPGPGKGEDLAYRQANQSMAYENYVGAASQTTVVDIDEAARAIAQLVSDPILRKRMGANARERAVKEFDWATVIKTYQTLWGEMNARRLAERGPIARPRNVPNNPWRMDPFTLFAAYPTEYLTPTTMVSLGPDVTWDKVKMMIDTPIARIGAAALPTEKELEALVEALIKVRQCSVGDLTRAHPPLRSVILERGVLWLAKYGFATVIGKSSIIPA